MFNLKAKRTTKMNENEWSGSKSNDNGHPLYRRTKSKLIAIADTFGPVIK